MVPARNLGQKQITKQLKGAYDTHIEVLVVTIIKTYSEPHESYQNINYPHHIGDKRTVLVLFQPVTCGLSVEATIESR